MATEKSAKKDNALKRVHSRTEEELRLKQQLLLGPELFIQNRSADTSLDKLSLKIQLAGGTEVTLADVIDEPSDYFPKFGKEYYRQIARLRNIDMALITEYRKPVVIARITNEFIYCRFPYMILRELRRKNPYIGEGIWDRKYKHFQHLSSTASQQLDLFIQEAIDTMKECSNWTEFKVLYSQRYRVYPQIDMFEDGDISK